MPTTVIHSIGTTGRDYSTLQSWEDAAPANLVTADQIWRGECYNDSTFSGSTTNLLIMGGSTTDATRYKELTTAAGQSFRDHASVQTNALYANTANGVTITSGNNYATATIQFTELHCHISNLQVANRGAGNGKAIDAASPGRNAVISNCIFESSGTGSRALGNLDSAKVSNSLFVCRGSGVSVAMGTSANNFYNCTFVVPSDKTAATNMFDRVYADSTFKNCAIFGSTGVMSGGSGTYTTCRVSAASPPTGCTTTTYDTSTGSGFQNTTDSTRDFRIKSTSALIDVGTTDATNAPVDIAGTSRPSGSAYDVGAWEYYSGSPPATYAPPTRRGGASFKNLFSM